MGGFLIFGGGSSFELCKRRCSCYVRWDAKPGRFFEPTGSMDMGFTMISAKNSDDRLLSMS
jgi:hypothetical protein